MCQRDTNHMKFGVAKLISDKVNVGGRNIIRKIEIHLIMIKGSISLGVLGKKKGAVTVKVISISAINKSISNSYTQLKSLGIQ